MKKWLTAVGYALGIIFFLFFLICFIALVIACFAVHIAFGFFVVFCVLVGICRLGIWIDEDL